MFFEMIARMLQQLTIGDATGTNCFASAATETGIDMARGGIAQREPSLLHGAHEVDPATRGFIFVAGLKISRARAETQPAMDAGQGFGFVEEPWKGCCRGWGHLG